MEPADGKIIVAVVNGEFTEKDLNKGEKDCVESEKHLFSSIEITER